MKISPIVWKPEDLVAGDPSIDFVNTVADWSGDPVDRLGDASALLAWAQLAGLLPTMSAGAGPAVGSGQIDGARAYEDARDLRSALHAAYSAVADGRPPPPSALAPIAEFAARAAARSTLVATGHGVERVWRDDVGAAERVVLELARRAEALLTEAALERLRRCDGNGCGWLFYDLSKNGRRRWCSMTACGAAEKIKRFRRKKKAAA